MLVDIPEGLEPPQRPESLAQLYIVSPLVYVVWSGEGPYACICSIAAVTKVGRPANWLRFARSKTPGEEQIGNCEVPVGPSERSSPIK
jgi:hypothetical protein